MVSYNLHCLAVEHSGKVVLNLNKIMDTSAMETTENVDLMEGCIILYATGGCKTLIKTHLIKFNE